jgi:hypothetical protein
LALFNFFLNFIYKLTSQFNYSQFSTGKPKFILAIIISFFLFHIYLSTILSIVTTMKTNTQEELKTYINLQKEQFVHQKDDIKIESKFSEDDIKIESKFSEDDIKIKEKFENDCLQLFAFQVFRSEFEFCFWYDKNIYHNKTSTILSNCSTVDQIDKAFAHLRELTWIYMTHLFPAIQNAKCPCCKKGLMDCQCKDAKPEEIFPEYLSSENLTPEKRKAMEYKFMTFHVKWNFSCTQINMEFCAVDSILSEHLKPEYDWFLDMFRTE